MNTTTVRYPGYAIEIPDGLIKPFKFLSSILTGIEFDHTFDLLLHPATSKLIKNCNDCVIASIGKEFAHDIKIADALSQWKNLCQYERATIIIKAAANTAPFDTTSIFEAGSSNDRD